MKNIFDEYPVICNVVMIHSLTHIKLIKFRYKTEFVKWSSVCHMCLCLQSSEIYFKFVYLSTLCLFKL